MYSIVLFYDYIQNCVKTDGYNACVWSASSRRCSGGHAGQQVHSHSSKGVYVSPSLTPRSHGTSSCLGTRCTNITDCSSHCRGDLVWRSSLSKSEQNSNSQHSLPLFQLCMLICNTSHCAKINIHMHSLYIAAYLGL